MLHSILVALDGEEGSDAVVELAVRWAKEFGARLTGIGVVDDPVKVHIVAVDADAMRAARLADEAGEYLALHDIEADSRPVPSSVPPADLLLQAASDLGAELLVLGAYGTPRLKEFLLGSVTKSLLKQSPFPLFLFH